MSSEKVDYKSTLSQVAEILAQDPSVDKKTLVLAGAEIGEIEFRRISPGISEYHLRPILERLNFAPQTIDKALDVVGRYAYARVIARVTKSSGIER